MIGAVADDFTGATDVAVAFRRAGLRVALLLGEPDATTALPACDAAVIALKTRTTSPADAVARSTGAARWLRDRGAARLYFKYCSTFDSRPEGNIGPVADALADLVGADLAVVVPSSPQHGRTQYRGHLFVGDVLLSDSPMRHHPLTPMTDARVVHLLQAQTPRAVRLVPLEIVRAGEAALRSALVGLRGSGVRYAVVDAIDDGDLATIGAVVRDAPLSTGAAGLAAGVGAALASGGGPAPSADDTALDGPAVVLVGSCSARTLEQVAALRRHHDEHRLDPVTTPDAARLAATALAWYDARDRADAALIGSSVPAEELRRIQATLGTARASAILEDALGRIARGLVARGVRRIVVAGGETSGAVVTALGVRAGLLGAEAAPGVPWIRTTGDLPLDLLLKSGNFGDPDLLVRAVDAGTRAAA